MKIKCPICNEEIEETHYATDIGMHLYWNHKPKDEKDAGDVYRYYAVLIFKIHEKIESLQNRVLVTADLVQNMVDDKLLQELKSLLEDNKK